MARGTGGLWAEWVAGLRLAFRSRLVRRLLLAVTVANFALAPVDILLTAWVKGPLHGGGSLLGVINAGALAGVVVGGMLLGSLSRRAAVKTLLTAGLLCAGVGYAALGAWPDAVWDTSLAVLVELGNGVTGGAATAWLLRAVPQGMLGRITGRVNALSTIMTPLGVALFGGLMAYLPLNVLWWVLGAMMAVAGLSLVFPVEDDPDRVESGEAGVAGR